MKISLFGIIWLLAIIISLTKNVKHTMYLLIFSFVFQSAWVIDVAGIDLNASLITSVFFIIRTLIIKKGRISIPAWVKYGLAFAFATLIISFISPQIFEGLVLRTMTNEGYNFNRIDTVTVSFSFSNLTLGLSVLLYLIDAIMISNIDFSCCWEQFERIYKNIFLFVLVVGVAHVVFTFFGFPLGLLRELFHNEYQIIGDTYFDYMLLPQYKFARLMSTFYEPSYCGAYISAALFFIYFSNLKKRNLYLAVGLVGLLLCMASTGFATLCIVIAIIVIVFVLKRKIPVKFIASGFVFCLIICVLLLSNETIREVIYSFTLAKFHSDSYDLRSIVNNFSLEVFYKTYGLGVGGNAVDTYSLFYSLLAQVGVIGTTLYVLFIRNLFHKTTFIRSLKPRWQIVCMILSPLVSSLLSCQALNFCVFWMGVCIYALYFSIINNRNEKELSEL